VKVMMAGESATGLKPPLSRWEPSPFPLSKRMLCSPGFKPTMHFPTFGASATPPLD